MKRALFSILMFVGLALSVSAQEAEMFYFMDAKATDSYMRDFIDRKAMIYRFDGDSEDEGSWLTKREVLNVVERIVVIKCELERKEYMKGKE